MSELEEFEKLAKAATPGPWGDASAGWGGAVWSGPVVVDDAGSVSAIGSGTFAICEMNVDSYHELERFEEEEDAVAQSETDAAFIAAANPQTVLALVECIVAADWVTGPHVSGISLSDSRDAYREARAKLDAALKGKP